jgi:hypothetical protein
MILRWTIVIYSHHLCVIRALRSSCGRIGVPFYIESNLVVKLLAVKDQSSILGTRPVWNVLQLHFLKLVFKNIIKYFVVL